MAAEVSTHMPLARHDFDAPFQNKDDNVSTHMPLARHDELYCECDLLSTFLLTCLLRGMTRNSLLDISGVNSFLLTCLLRGMTAFATIDTALKGFYSHASCEA